MRSLLDKFNGSQLKVVYMEECLKEETAFLIYVWTTRVITQINSPNCHMPEIILLKILVPTMPAIKDTYGRNQYPFTSKTYLQSQPPTWNFLSNFLIFSLKTWSHKHQWQYKTTTTTTQKINNSPFSVVIIFNNVKVHWKHFSSLHLLANTQPTIAAKHSATLSHPTQSHPKEQVP